MMNVSNFGFPVHVAEDTRTGELLQGTDTDMSVQLGSLIDKYGDRRGLKLVELLYDLPSTIQVDSRVGDLPYTWVLNPKDFEMFRHEVVLRVVA